jgi:hypothetical protein
MTKKRRKNLSRAEFLARREARYRELVAENPGAPTIYHVRHSCGHDAYWDNGPAGAIASLYPCPWCGGETARVIPLRNSIILHGRDNEHVRKNSETACECEGATPSTVIIKHMTDDSCCQGTGSIN